LVSIAISQVTQLAEEIQAKPAITIARRFAARDGGEISIEPGADENGLRMVLLYSKEVDVAAVEQGEANGSVHPLPGSSVYAKRGASS
jgi:hypothetical protein